MQLFAAIDYVHTRSVRFIVYVTFCSLEPSGKFISTLANEEVGRVANFWHGAIPNT